MDCVCTCITQQNTAQRVMPNIRTFGSSSGRPDKSPRAGLHTLKSKVCQFGYPAAQTSATPLGFKANVVRSYLLLFSLGPPMCKVKTSQPDHPDGRCCFVSHCGMYMAETGSLECGQRGPLLPQSCETDAYSSVKFTELESQIQALAA